MNLSPDGNNSPSPDALAVLPAAAVFERRPVFSGSRLERLLPMLRTLRKYRWAYLRPDFVAGLTTALFTIPQSLAYALIAGFPPAAGLSTAVAASVLGATFGSSEFVIDGPTNAISVMVAANAALFVAHGDPVQAIILLTLMVGAIQFLAGLLRAGTLARFVSEPVLTGFTAGAGVYIVINQIPSFLGIEKAAIPATVLGFTLPKAAIFDLLRLSFALHTTATTALAIGAFTFLTIRGTQSLDKRLGFRLPATFIAVVLATVIVAAFGLDVGTGAHRVKVVRDIQPLTRALPHLHLPHVDLAGHAKPGGRCDLHRGHGVGGIDRDQQGARRARRASLRRESTAVRRRRWRTSGRRWWVALPRRGRSAGRP